MPFSTPSSFGATWSAADIWYQLLAEELLDLPAAGAEAGLALLCPRSAEVVQQRMAQLVLARAA